MNKINSEQLHEYVMDLIENNTTRKELIDLLHDNYIEYLDETKLAVLCERLGGDLTGTTIVYN